MDLRYKSESLTTPEDDRWLGNDSRSSTEGTNTIQLDGASLVAIYPDGLIKSGTALQALPQHRTERSGKTSALAVASTQWEIVWGWLLL
jgi:hypothetical protein